MIYRGPSFIAVVWLGSSPPLTLSLLQLFITLPRRSSLPTGEGGWYRGGSGRETKSFSTTRKLALYKSFNPLWEEGGQKIWAKRGSQKSRRDALTVREPQPHLPPPPKTSLPQPCKETDIIQGALEKNIFIFPETFHLPTLFRKHAHLLEAYKSCAFCAVFECAFLKTLLVDTDWIKTDFFLGGGGSTIIRAVDNE
jgi:hypothetical protein